MNKWVAKLPKVELHCHLEGAMSPALTQKLADRNGLSLPAELFTAENEFQWADFLEFLNAYDLASAAIKTARDYSDVTYEYLKSCALEGAIYVEVFSSPDHAAAAGMTYEDHLEGIIEGCRRAEKDFGIVGRVIPTCVRHLGPERAVAVAEQVVSAPSSYVVGFGMGGDEAHLNPVDFAPAFELVDNAGLPTTIHAGEVQGAKSVWNAINDLPVCRIGHGVRAIEDEKLVFELAKRQIHLEVCPGSNIALSVYPDFSVHPLPDLIKKGISCGLNSDDPPYFKTTIGGEYEKAITKMGLDQNQLIEVSRQAMKAAFVDETIKRKLLDKINAYE